MNTAAFPWFANEMKKERYFTQRNLAQKTLEMLRDIQGIGLRHEQILSPEKSALLVLDMQRYFLEASSHAFIPAAEAVLPGIAKLAATYSRRSFPVVFSRHLNSPDGAGMMARWWRELLQPENPLCEITPALDISQEIVIQKEQYDAFHETGLAEALRERDVTQVVVCGVMTHLCCETTARSAFMRGFEVFFAIDGTASYTEAFHRATLLNLCHGFAAPVLVDEVLRAIDGS
jgi:isochorismate hydrolase